MPAPALMYEIGMTRYFGQSDIGSFGLLHGWSTPEDAHVWNDGPEAMLQLVTTKPRLPCRITVEGEPFLGTKLTRQDMTLFVNGLRLGFWRMSEARPYRLSAVLEPEHLIERNGRTLLNLVWYLPTAVRPAELGIGSDNRELGFCFRSLTISEDAALT